MNESKSLALIGITCWDFKSKVILCVLIFWPISQQTSVLNKTVKENLFDFIPKLWGEMCEK